MDGFYGLKKDDSGIVKMRSFNGHKFLAVIGENAHRIFF